MMPEKTHTEIWEKLRQIEIELKIHGEYWKIQSRFTMAIFVAITASVVAIIIPNILRMDDNEPPSKSSVPSKVLP